MRTFDVQSIELAVPVIEAFRFIADPANLPRWAKALQWTRGGRVVITTPSRTIAANLEVRASEAHGTIDWYIRLPSGDVARTCSRLVEGTNGNAIYTFVLLAPPVPLEQLEEVLKARSAILREHLQALSRLLDGSREGAYRRPRAPLLYDSSSRR
jgi:hypothetical protein